MGIKDVIKIENLIRAYNQVRSNRGWKYDGHKFTESVTKLGKLCNDVGSGRYKPDPIRRVWIPKANGTDKRPWGLGSIKDKIVQEALRNVLERVYEPIFQDSSHGFRPNRSCHTALKEVVYKTSNYKWYIVGNIEKCFDRIDHGILINLVKKRISCKGIEDLLWKILRTPVVERSKRGHQFTIKPKMGIPQGGVISPLLRNIYLHELDEYMEEKSKNFVSGNRRRSNMKRAREMGTPQGDPMDTSYKRLKYIRYAEDYLVSIIGSKEEACTIQLDMERILYEKLKLISGNSVPKVVHTSEGVEFLGFKIKTLKTLEMPIKKNVEGRKGRVQTRTLLIMPLRRVYERLKSKGFIHQTRGTPTRIGWLIHESPETIVKYYSWVYQGIANYYSCAMNSAMLARVDYLLRYSCCLTLASKMRLGTKKKVYSKFGYNLKVSDEVEFKGYKWSKREFKIKEVENWSERLNKKWIRRTSDIESNKCVVCGAEGEIEMHHVNHLRKMKVVSKRNPMKKNELSKLRRQIPVCKKCHKKIHAGVYDGLALKEL